ncbi:MAG: hypothetical protein MJK04_30750, partial [Psychrosphaera sp.]|nr:hypothetical protein [Psychrosphaera sp.]
SSIVATISESDGDIGRLNWHSGNNRQIRPQILHRSTVTEYSAQYQPGTDLIAFISSRSGSNQIWLGGPAPRQLSKLAENKLAVDTFIWSLDGQSIFYLANHQLQLLNLNGQTVPLNTPFKILKLYQQIDSQRLLLNVLDGQRPKLLIFNINTGQQQVLYDGHPHWAQLSDNHDVFITDEDKHFNQVIQGVMQPMQQLEAIRAWAKFYFLKNPQTQQNQLLIFDEDNTLWVYDLASKRNNELLKIDKSIKHIDSIDLEHQRLLFSKIVSAKREVVMFSK